MRFNQVLIRDTEGERRLQIDQLPLRLGTGIDCELRLPGPGNSAVALIDDLDGQPFVQPTGRSGSLQINGASLTTSRRLSAGDVLEFFGTRIEVGEEGDALLLQLRLEDSAYITKPPEIADTAVTEETIAPTVFRRAAEARTIDEPSAKIHWRTAAGIAIALLLGISWLLFTSKSIQFEVQPGDPDELSVSGGWFRLPVGDRILLREGTYTVNISKQGYFDINQDFAVDEKPSRTIRLEMRKLPGQLTVITDPVVEAFVTVDDTRVGQAPYGPLELEPGTHSVVVRADRFLPFEDRLRVPGLGIQQEMQVQLVPRWANVDISSIPSGASVYEGQTLVGQTPIRLELMEGTHTLSVVHDGFKAWDGTIETEPNRDQVLPTIEMEPANAQLLVNSIPRGANVTVNGRYRGQSPITLALSPDVNYEIGLSKAGYGSASRQVRLQSAASEEMTVDMTARVGKLTVASLPADSVIYVDGRSRGTGSITLNLSSAPHRLEVRRDGYQTFTRTVTPRPGYPQTIQVRLLSDAEIAARGTSSTVNTAKGQVMRRVEPGSFVMGASRREQGRRANEVLLPVTITKPFYIGIKEVTNRDFRKFRQNHFSDSGLHASLSGDLNPVVNVTWESAVEYCNWLSAEEGLPLAYEKKFEKWQPVRPTPDGYRLPTEAEWVWAIRYQARSSALVFPWGARMPPRRDSGNYADKSAIKLVPTIIPGFDDGFASTAPVGTFPANALGIYDGGGNVAEWVQNYYSVPTPGQLDPVKDPVGPPRGANRVIRGSTWRQAGVAQLRLSYRDFGNGGRPDLGFRLARNAE